jgi:hypothetical protein
MVVIVDELQFCLFVGYNFDSISAFIGCTIASGGLIDGWFLLFFEYAKNLFANECLSKAIDHVVEHVFFYFGDVWRRAEIVWWL